VPLTIKNVNIKNAKVGIRIGPGAGGPSGGVSIENPSFDNVQTPYEVNHRGTLSVTGSRITNDPKNRGTERSHTSKGWRKINGPPLPVFCSTCKTIFPSKNYVFGGTYFYSWNNEETCPNCGALDAKLSEGLFNLAGEVAEIIYAPDITHAMLKALVAVADEVGKGAVSPDAAIATVELINPRIASFLKRARSISLGTFMFALSALDIGAKLAGIGALAVGVDMLILQKQSMAPVDNTIKQKLLSEILIRHSTMQVRAKEMSQHPDADTATQPRTEPSDGKPSTELPSSESSVARTPN
jgi:hypothetical protein